jgi:quercetin dioxygenase-like cupin family protein
MTQLITPVTRSVISSPDTQAAIWFLGALSQLRLSGEQTGGAFALADNLARRGNASPVHVHDRDDETFFVLDGELRVLAGEDDYTAGPGTVAVLPRRLRHAYVVVSATARFLTLHAPAGFEQFAAEVRPRFRRWPGRARPGCDAGPSRTTRAHSSRARRRAGRRSPRTSGRRRSRWPARPGAAG